jgi:hypothetical protein
LADQESGSKPQDEVRQGLSAILERIAGFFDIFDLSFFVSGATALAAVSFWCWQNGVSIRVEMPVWLQVMGFVIGSYVLGLICFAIARWPRRYLRWGRTEGGKRDTFREILRAHGLAEIPAIASYIGRADIRGEARLYVRLWADVRQAPGLAPSFSLLRRYWVMSATYDGLVIALFVWTVVIASLTLGLGGIQCIEPRLGAVVMLALLASAWACWGEAGRYVDYQIEELVASLAGRLLSDFPSAQ